MLLYYSQEFTATKITRGIVQFMYVPGMSLAKYLCQLYAYSHVENTPTPYCSQ